MAIYASKTARGFFDSELFALEALPEDAVEISDELHQACLASPAIDWSGATPLPCDPPPLTAEQLAAKRVREIDAELASIDERKVRAITDAILSSDTTRLAQLEQEAETLRTERASLVA